VSEKIDEAALFEAIARADETPPSPDQLKRWRRGGLIPRPEVAHLPGVRGSRALYPAWAVEQLLVVIRLHRSTHRLPDLCLALWWEGHWVRPDAIRGVLIKPLERLSQEAREVCGDERDPYEAADALVAAMKSEAKTSPTSELIRKRLSGPADLMDLLWTFLVIGFGGQAPWEQEDRSLPDPAPGALELVAAAAGADRAMHDDPLGEGPLVPPDFDMPGFIEELRDAGGFEVEDLAREIHEASDEELAQAREDALLFCGPLTQICSVLEELLGDDVAGFGSLRMLEDATTLDRATLIRCMLIIRKLTGDAAFVAVAELVEEEGPRYAAIAELRSGLPEHRELLRLDWAKRLAALPPSEADRVREDVARYLRAHPWVAAALDDHGE
jgi:hypothetical protein